MKLKNISFIVLSIVALCICVILSLVFGARSIPFSDVIYTLTGHLQDTLESAIVMERIPRTIFCVLAGMSLGVAGALMQAVTRNPIADPSILGVNTGASLFVVSGIAFFQISTAFEYIWFALFGATIIAIFVYGVGSLGQGGATPIKLALAGAATSIALSSLVSAIMLPRSSVMDSFRFWQVGSVSGASFQGVLTILPFLCIGLLMAFMVIPSLNALSLGEEAAIGLGVKVKRTRVIGALAGVLLCGATTALAGPIGFIGLMVPHLMRILFGPDLRYIIPMSAIGGATLLTVSDVIGRLVGSPSELEVGIVTAIIGAPILIMIVRKAKVRNL